MRVAVTGTTGRVGAALTHFFAKRHEVVSLPRADFDLSDPDSLAAALSGLECDVLINPAAITSLEACEDQPDRAARVNGIAPGEMAHWAAKNDVRLIQISTDYVFDGILPGLRSEDEAAVPLSVYGRSKLAGEMAVLAHPGHCVVRVSWVFGPEKPSFIDQIFDAALDGRPLSAVADKFSSPTCTNDLAEWIEALAMRKSTGVFHACNSGGEASWHDLATVVVDEMTACGVLQSAAPIARMKLDEVAAFRAPRPRFTAMDPSRLSRETGITPRPWQAAVSEHIRHRCASL